MSVKITKKELKRIGEDKEGYYFTGNVYSYENITNYLSQLAWRTEKGHKTENKQRIKEIKKELQKNVNSKYYDSLNEIVSNIESINHDNYGINQVFYSAGLYGNSGQLHELKLYKNHNIVACYTLYY